MKSRKMNSWLFPYLSVKGRERGGAQSVFTPSPSKLLAQMETQIGVWRAGVAAQSEHFCYSFIYIYISICVYIYMLTGPPEIYLLRLQHCAVFCFDVMCFAALCFDALYLSCVVASQRCAVLSCAVPCCAVLWRAVL